jgi:osmotically-inducible protein OsmY
MTSMTCARIVSVWCRAVVVALLIAIISLSATPMAAHADDAALMTKVEAALRANRKLNGAAAYTAAPGVVVLYGTVFDNNSSMLAQKTAQKVPGVTKVINTLQTSTGIWMEQEVRINDTLQLNGFPGVRAKVIGPEVYLSGQVSSDQEKQRAVRVVSSISNLQVVNFLRAVPGPVFSTPSFF